MKWFEVLHPVMIGATAPRNSGNVCHTHTQTCAFYFRSGRNCREVLRYLGSGARAKLSFLWSWGRRCRTQDLEKYQKYVKLKCFIILQQIFCSPLTTPPSPHPPPRPHTHTHTSVKFTWIYEQYPKDGYCKKWSSMKNFTHRKVVWSVFFLSLSLQTMLFAVTQM